MHCRQDGELVLRRVQFSIEEKKGEQKAEEGNTIIGKPKQLESAITGLDTVATQQVETAPHMTYKGLIQKQAVHTRPEVGMLGYTRSTMSPRQAAARKNTRPYWEHVQLA